MNPQVVVRRWKAHGQKGTDCGYQLTVAGSHGMTFMPWARDGRAKGKNHGTTTLPSLPVARGNVGATESDDALSDLADKACRVISGKGDGLE